jgi:hypothetical protein
LIHANSATHVILEYIKAHPGCVRADILGVLPEDFKRGSVSNIMGRLQRTHAIENRGGSGRAARWYAIESTVENSYFLIACELLDELKTVHHTRREEYFAERLQEIFS